MTHEFTIIRERHDNHPSVDDQVVVAQTLYAEGITSREDALKEDEIRELLAERGIDLEYRLRTTLDNLCAIPVATRFFPSGAKRVLISERRDEVVFGELEATLRVDQAALLTHIRHDESRFADEDDDGLRISADGGASTVRDVIAEDAGIDPDTVEQYLQHGNQDTQRHRLNAAIEAISDADRVTKRDTYGKIEFRHKAYRYYLI